MDSFAFLNFVIKNNDRAFQFSVQPGCPWEDAQSALDQFKTELDSLKKQQEDKAQENKEQ